MTLLPFRKPKIQYDTDKAYRHVVACAGLDFDNDGFTPDHVVLAIFGKGLEAGRAEGRKPNSGNYRMSREQIRDIAKGVSEIESGNISYGKSIIEDVLGEIEPRWPEL